MATPGEQRLFVTLLGDLTLSEGGRALDLPASRKTRALFVYLLLCGKPVRRERLCELFFDIPDDPRAALRWSLTKIRAMLGDEADALAADRERVWLHVERFATDVDSLKHLAGGADLLPAAELAMEPALPGLELAGCDAFNAWLAAEQAEIDALRGEVLARTAALPDLSPERRRLFAAEAELLGAAPAPEALVATPVAARAEERLEQTIRYCFAVDGVRIAHACTGEGPPLVKAANWLNHLELDWTGPVWGRLFTALSRDHTLVRYDERGNGLSDWAVEDLSFEAFVRDLETVVDSLGLERFPLLGISQGSAVSIEYAARHPERVSKLVLLGGYAAGWRHLAGPDEAASREAVITLAQHGWGSDNPAYRQLFSLTFMPSASHEELDWFNEFQRETASAENAVRFLKAFAEIDVRERLGAVRAPTLVLHARGDQRVPIVRGVELAASIPGASLVTLDTDNHIPLSREPATERIIDCIRAFLAEPPAAGPAIRRMVNAAR
jgi:pimeloyl-ACP methyl ester carboxylesterase/DNA-binding SARP family transcriptional activator